MKKLFITNELANFLGLDANIKYSKSEINKIIKNKELKSQIILNYFPQYKMCYCGGCPVNKTAFINYINSYYLIKEKKPNCFSYGYDDKPINLTSLNFEL
jgi:hypothetical protein